ncbi:MAG: phosphoglucomutase [Elusimicrobiales bacterium]
MAHENAGSIAETVINPRHFRQEFFSPSQKPHKVKFGTSGHRGKLGAGFCELHALAIAQAVARLHIEKGVKGPVICGGDTRLMSAETARICAQALAANGIETLLSESALPTPVMSSAIMSGAAAGCLNATASHNPPQDMGLKYNPSTGGPASGATTALIEAWANEYMESPALIKRITFEEAQKRGLARYCDFTGPYIEKLALMVNFDAIRQSGLRIAINTLGGASGPFYQAAKERLNLPNLKLVFNELDPAFGFIPLDHDGQIRMDPSSPYPMKPLIELAQSGGCDFAGASDPDADRFGAATPKAGLVPPNHALAVLLDYLITHRPQWPQSLRAARTIGTTHLLDKIAAAAGRGCDEKDVGFKHFVDGISSGRYILAGEESAGLSAYGWTTEKDGILAVFLLAEAMAVTGKDLSELYSALTARHGAPCYRRTDFPLTEAARSRIKSFSPDSFAGEEIAGETVQRVRASDGIKLYLEDSWVLVRLSGTEPIAKLYAETFRGPRQLDAVIDRAAAMFMEETHAS